MVSAGGGAAGSLPLTGCTAASSSPLGLEALPGPGLALCLAPQMGHKDFSVGESRRPEGYLCLTGTGQQTRGLSGHIKKGQLLARKPTRGTVLQQLTWAWFVLALAMPTPAPEAHPALGE